MPDLNLIDDEGVSDEMPEGVQEVVSSGGGGGGGATKVIIILLVLLIALAGVTYLLNYMGIVQLWGKKPVTVTVEEQLPTEYFDDQAFAEQPVDTSWMTEQPAAQGDDVALLDTTPLEETAQAAAPAEQMPADMMTPEMSASTPKLSDMKGDFTVQVVAFREKEKADRIVQNLEVAGYPAFIEMVEMKGAEWYTVRIGRYASKAEANEAVKTFAAEIRANYFVDRVRTR